MMTRALILCLILLTFSGCAHVYDGFDWQEVKKIETVTITKVERADAQEYCTELYGTPTLACVDKSKAVNWLNCTIVVPPNSVPAIGHEAVHCFGYIH